MHRSWVISDSFVGVTLKNPRFVMKVGGWENFQSIKPYLSKSSESTVNDAFDAL